MIEQNKNDQANGEDQISELANFSEYMQELDAEESAGVSGGGGCLGINIKGAITGWKEAAHLGGDRAAKQDAFKFGLRETGPNWKEGVKDYAFTRVAGS